jgi:hypothetical protein
MGHLVCYHPVSVKVSVVAIYKLYNPSANTIYTSLISALYGQELNSERLTVTKTIMSVGVEYKATLV